MAKSLSEEKNIEEEIDEKLNEISNNKKLSGKVYQAWGVFFIISEGSITEMTNDISSSPRGGWFPDIITGITAEESKAIDKIMSTLDIDEDFFDEMLDCCSGDADDEELDEWVDDEFEDDEDFAVKYKAIQKKIKSSKKLFSSMTDFISKFKRNGLDAGSLYYEWEGEWFDLYDNIAEFGDERGEIDNLSDEEWLDVLNNIEKHIVTADK